MGIRVLGPLVVDGSGRLGPRDRSVLQALAVRQGRAVTADELADALWGDRPPASAHKNVQSCIVRLRKELGAGTIETVADGYRLSVPPDQVDACVFESHVTRARQLLELGAADRAAFVLERALDLWRGAAFAELPEWAPARREARRLDQLRLDAEELLLDAQLRRGRARDVLPRAHEMVLAAPLRERRWELLALAQYRTGAQGEALRSIQELRTVLTHELGIAPGPEMSALEQSILRRDPSLLVAAPRTGTNECPWPGLMAYDVEDAERFFGRDAEVAACVAKVERESFLALVGPSGSGKSSLLRAGVLATLRGRGHRAVVIAPGPRPSHALSALPDGAPPDTVLAVDQAEEVFTVCTDPEERRRFLHRLADEARRRPVVVSLRGDCVSQVTEHPEFRSLVEQGLHLVGALDDQGLRQAVVGPARQAGLVIEPGLVELLIREVHDDPGALPLLSHVLLETWQRREGNTLTVDGYHASGGIHGAVAQSAEELYSRIEPAQRDRLRDLLLRLVLPGDDGEPVRARVPRRLVAADPGHDRLIEALVAARLVTADEDVLQVTHEALAHAWPRLRQWLEDDVEGQRIRHHLSSAAEAWEALDRPDSELYRGVRLARACEWEEATASNLTRGERDFLAASRAASDAEEQSAADRARAQARLITRLRLVLAGAIVLLVLAAAAGGAALIQSDRANEHAAAAEASQIRAVARRAGASALVIDDIDTSLLLGVAAARMDDSPQTLGSLIGVLAKSPALVRAVPLAGSDPRTLDVHPGGLLVAVADTHHRIRLLELATGRVVAHRQVGPPVSESEEVRPMVFSPDGRYLAAARTALRPRPVALLDATTLEPVPTQPGGLGPGPWQTLDLKFSHDDTRLVAVINRMVRSDGRWSTHSTTAFVWDVDDPARPMAAVDLTNPGGRASAALSPDGRLLYTLAPDLHVHDLQTGRSRVLATEDVVTTFGSVDVSPDGRVLAQGRDTEGETVLRDARTGRLLHHLRLPGAQGGVRFTDDGDRVLTVLWHDREVALWSARTGRPLFRAQLTEGSSNAVDVDARGRAVISGAVDGTIRTWDATGRSRYLRRSPVPDLPRGARGGSCLTTPSAGGTMIAHHVCSGLDLEPLVLLDTTSDKATLVPLRGGQQVGSSGSWDATGSRWAEVVGDEVQVRDRAGTLLASATAGADVVDAQFTPGGGRLVLSAAGGTVRMVDAATLKAIGRPLDFGGTARAVTGPDERLAFVVVGGVDAAAFWKNDAQRWALVDLERGVVIRGGELDMGFVTHFAFSPDGRHSALASDSGHVQVIDLDSGRPVREPQLVHEGARWVSFSSDGRRLVSGGFAGDVALWDVDTATVTARVRIPESVPVSPVFARDDRTVLLVPWWTDRGVYAWDPSRERAIAFACQAVGRELTRAEWQDYFGGLPYRPTCPR